VENMTDYQYAWMLYLTGATGCVLAAWLMFRRFGRAVTHFFVITVMVVLFTPYAIDAEKMTMAPAVYTLLFGFLDGGFASVKPVLKLMLGLWGCALILSLIYQLLTRNRGGATHEIPEPRRRQSTRQNRNQAYVEDDEPDFDYSPQARRANSSRGLSREERIARDELLNEEPIRAIR
jgi:hypothetical protein